MSSDWISDRFPSYFLDEQTVLKFLKEKFGDSGAKDSDFDVQFENDHYTFRVPRKLEEGERTELIRLREDDDSY